MEYSLGIVEIFGIIFSGFFVVGIVVFLVLLSNALDRGLLLGLKCALFPIGTYYYCKENWEEKKVQAWTILICSIGSVVFKLLEWLVN